MNSKRYTYLSLGSNLGDKLDNLQLAIDKIALRIGTVEKISSVYRTASWGFESEDFFNICIQVSTLLEPEALLEAMLEIERNLGRKRKQSDSYESRTIDLDILFYENEIILSDGLQIPHPRILERKFVLAPLAEIAQFYMHPVHHETIATCLSNCKDESDIERLDLGLQRPLPLSEKYNYIAIEGNIGSGKTSLTKMLSEKYNAKTVLERFADNPFLPKFYLDKERYAFPLEMSFLADRYQQLSEDLAQLDLFRNFVVSDYYIFKSLIFAQITLHEDELFLYRKMFDIMYKEITKPDLYVYLYQNTKRLLENIKKRGRSYEQNIEADYLQKIHDGYKNFIDSQRDQMNILVLDVSDLDFVSSKEDFEEVLQKIN
ncbi:MAG: 2-amino-4-hydroxy-6-hydroxymethyldihydropteridine diphosphokinase [Flavobacteriaceae bacterium]|nr:2-amino-4-hydroxy-6-hydroxymethyldihydropteridine diphosphokinase [Flavobacteriaceae bacterium]|tara:strand:+ start:97585 stop:98706 length:1122 start_codon:yes stop_codon:yes gene_type:complete